MTKCSVCADETKLRYRCNYCDDAYCERHRLPEDHNCDGVNIKKTETGPDSYETVEPDTLGTREADWSEGKSPPVKTHSRRDEGQKNKDSQPRISTPDLSRTVPKVISLGMLISFLVVTGGTGYIIASTQSINFTTILVGFSLSVLSLLGWLKSSHIKKSSKELHQLRMGMSVEQQGV